MSYNGLALLASRSVAEGVDVNLTYIHLPGLHYRVCSCIVLGELLDKHPVGVVDAVPFVLSVLGFGGGLPGTS